MSLTTPRDFLAIVFRQRRVFIPGFIVIFAGAVLFSLFLLDRFEARVLILVDHGERSTPVVTPEANAASGDKSAVTEDEMNSEVALLQSRDLLEQVVVACGLDENPSSFLNKLLGDSKVSKEKRIAKAVRALANKLDVQVVKRTNVISVSYPSSDPQLSARVLRTLTDLYLKKHVAVHRPPGALDFFQQEAEQYRNGLSQAEAQLVRFTHDQGVVAAALETEAALHKLTEFEAMQGETQATVAQTQHRIRALGAQMAELSPRMTTQVKTSENGQLLEQLKATLLTLELKRTELLEKFEPSYRPVQEAETEIAQTKAAIAEAEKSQLREETTDRDPAFELVREELSKARADLAGLQARANAIGQTVYTYQAQARHLQQYGIVQQDLIRKAKAEEDNYMLYLHKREEARISDALDTRQILNVSVAEAAAAPALPAHSDVFYVLLSGLIAGLASIGLAFASDSLDPTLRTPDEVESALGIPVLLAVPKKANGGIGIHVS